jgi:hypothetical protein
MADLSAGIAQFMVDVGLLDTILPFMLIFTILFAILQKTKVFGTVEDKPKQNINAMVAFCVAFFFIASLVRVQILTAVVQKLALVIVAIICILLLTGLWGKEVSFMKYKWLLAVLFIVVLLIFATSLGWFNFDDLGIIGAWIFHPIVIMSVAFILAVYLITRPVKTAEEKAAEARAKAEKAEKPKPEKPKPGEKPKAPPEQAKPKFVREIPKEELYGGEDRSVWKE